MSHINTDNLPHAKVLRELSQEIREHRRDVFAKSTVQPFVDTLMDMCVSEAKEGHTFLQLADCGVNVHTRDEAKWFEKMVQEVFLELGYGVAVLVSPEERRAEIFVSWGEIKIV